MVRRHFNGLTPRRLAILTGALGSFALTSAFVGATASVYRAQFEAKATISVGAEIYLSGMKFGLNKSGRRTIVAPHVESVAVSQPNIVRIDLGNQNYTVSGTSEDNLSQVQPSLKQDYIENGFRISFGPEEESQEEHGNERLLLSSVFYPRQSLIAALNTQKAELTTAVETKLAQDHFVAWNEVQGPDRLGYSDVVEHFFGREYAAANAIDSAVNSLSAAAKPGVITIVEYPRDPQSNGPQKASGDRAPASYSSKAVNTPINSNPPLFDNEIAPVTMGTQKIVSSGKITDVRQYTDAARGMDSQQGPVGPAPIVSYFQPASTVNTQGSSVNTQSPPALAPPALAPPAPTKKESTSESIQSYDEGSDSRVRTPQAPTYSGRVVEAFTGGLRGVQGAEVQILGTQWVVTTDPNGKFAFDKISVEGIVPVIISKTGFLKRRVELKKATQVDVELVSENSVSLSAVAAGAGQSAAQSSFVFGQLVSVTGSPGESLDNMRVEVSGPGKPLLVYIDSNGIPSAGLTSTSSRGQFMLLGVLPGTYLITPINALGRENAPHIIYVGQNEGLVRKFSLGQSMFISGRVLNAASNNASVAGATVRLLGSEKTILTDKDGRFTLGPIAVDCSSTNYVQVEKEGYYRNRIDYACSSELGERGFYVFPASYVDGIAMDSALQLQAANGVVLGHASFPFSVKMQLWGPEELNPGPSERGVDFYFETDGVLSSSRESTTSNGNFTILNAPEGLSYIQAFNKDGNTLSFWPIFLSPSTINVYAQ